MQALILAAGKGNRLGYLGQKTPKCLLSVANKPIIDRAIDNLLSININTVYIVINYKADKIKEHLVSKYPAVNFIFIDENAYKQVEHNNIYSVYLSLPFIKDDFILIEGDILFSKELLQDLIKNKSNKAVLSTYAPYLDGNGIIVKNNKCINLTKYSFSIENCYKTVNIYYISKQYKNKLYKDIKKFIDKNGYNHYYEEAFSIKKFKPQIVSPTEWYEVDNIADYDAANIIYSKGKEKYNLLSNSFGGFWRIPKLIDCCYLTNPFFNRKRIFNNIKPNLELLANSYPYGEEETRKFISDLFNLKSNKNILVGNGASELIRLLGRYFNKTKAFISLPAFNEYLEAFKSIQFKDIEKSKVIIFINPNNPTSDYIDPKDIQKLILKYPEKIFIIDESFNDFVDPKIKESFIGCKYQNVIVVKSLGKSYGINGLKLGLLYSANIELLDDIKKLLPSWNINSIAQEFLCQIQAYKSEQEIACKELVVERQRFIENLRFLKHHIEVNNSQTNFIYIKLLDVAATKFCIDFLDKYNIFIKDLSDKQGLEGQNYIRISINDRKTNDIVQSCFMDYFYKL